MFCLLRVLIVSIILKNTWLYILISYNVFILNVCWLRSNTKLSKIINPTNFFNDFFIIIIQMFYAHFAINFLFIHKVFFSVIKFLSRKVCLICPFRQYNENFLNFNLCIFIYYLYIAISFKMTPLERNSRNKKLTLQ